MNIPLPSVLNPKLKSQYLETIASFLLEELYATEDDLTRSTDSSYSRGCTTFDRQKNRIIAEARSGNFPWLQLSNTGFDLVFTIDGVPCRFSNDDPLSPSKSAVVSINKYQMDFLEFIPKGEPGQFCFVIDRGINGASQPKVVFLGFSLTHELLCEWVSDTVRVFHAPDHLLPEAIEIPKAPITPKPQPAQVEKEQDKSYSNNSTGK